VSDFQESSPAASYPKVSPPHAATAAKLIVQTGSRVVVEDAQHEATQHGAMRKHLVNESSLGELRSTEAMSAVLRRFNRTGGFQPVTRPKKDKVILLVLEVLGLGTFGIDRMYLGGPNLGLGIAKLLTFSGFGIWGLIDFFVIIGNAVNKQPAIDTLGMHYDFDPNTIGTAHALGVIGLVLVLCPCACCVCSCLCSSALMLGKSSSKSSSAPVRDEMSV